MAGAGIPFVNFVCSTTVISFRLYFSMAGRPKKYRNAKNRDSWKESFAPFVANVCNKVFETIFQFLAPLGALGVVAV